MTKAYPRARKLDELIKEALAEIVATELTDPRLDLVTVTGVRTVQDLSMADVYVTAHGDESRYSAMLEGLRSASGRMRSLLGRRVRMRQIPELHFHVDESVDAGMRITEILHQTESRMDAEGHLPPAPLEDES